MNIKQLISTLLLCYCILLNSLPVYGQDYLFEVDNITPDDGLANLLTLTVHKSQTGFVWMSTRHGLNKYDGYSFKLYTEEANGLTNHERILEIQEDDNGLLWLFSVRQSNPKLFDVDIFDPIQEKALPIYEYFKDELPFDHQKIHQIKIVNNDNSVWMSTSNGELYQYKNNTFRKVIQLSSVISSLTIDNDNRLWLGAENILYYISMDGEIIGKKQFGKPIYRIFIDNQKAVFVHTLKGESTVDEQNLWKRTGEDWQLFEFKKDGKKVEFNFPYLTSDDFWVVNFSRSINVFDTKGEWIFDTQPYLDVFLGISTKSFCEAGGYYWIASSLGVLKLSVKRNPFQTISTATSTQKAIPSSRVIVGNGDDIYFSNRYIWHYNTQTEQIKSYPSISHPSFAAFYKNERLFFFDAHSMNIFNLKDKSLSTVKLFEPAQNIRDVNNIAFTSDSSELVLSTNNGLCFYNFNNIINNTSSDLKKHILNNTFSYYTLRDSNKFWVATKDGISLIQENGELIKAFNTSTGDLPINDIRHIYKDGQGVFWLSSVGGGIIKWQPSVDKTSTYEQFTVRQGLSNDYIYAIYEDQFGYLWASSDKGLMRINKANFNVQIFYKENGLPHNEFNFPSHYQAKDSAFYFGGLGGMITLHPKDFEQIQKNDVPLIFTDYSILEEGETEVTNRFNELLLNRIKIKPTDKYFELAFALMDFAKPEFHQYRYKIEGYSDNWTVTNQNKIRITHLPYGNYTLKIQGKHTNKGWSSQELTLTINILKPFYLQWWFIILMIAVLAGAVYLYFRNRIQRFKNIQNQLEAEVKARTATIQEQTEKLKVLDEAKTRFFSNITHEFRTPLTLILGPLEQIQQKRPPEKKLYKSLQGVQKNAQHLLGLINQLLDISKLESGNMKLEMSHGDIIEQTQSIVERMQPMADQKSIQLIFQSSSTQLVTNYDQKKWNKIIFNLLSNAIKFTPNDGSVTVDLREIKNQNLLEVNVSDTGIGISPKHLSNIFNRFYQTDDSTTRMQEGTGIGLALVKELIELQNGKITVQSVLNEGTTFTIQLPVTISKATELNKDELQAEFSGHQPVIETPETATTPINTAENIKENKLQLLIIEDNQELRSYIRSCIDENIYQVTEAKDGEEGIEKAQAIVPDLIISDVMMPKKDGFEVTQTIRQTLSTSHIPIVLLTAKSALESRLEGLRRGADAYLTKPFSPQELVLRIQKLIEIRQMLQRLFASDTQKDVSENIEKTYEKENDFIQQLKTFILNNIDNSNLDADMLGKEFLLSRMQLHRKIKALTNLPTGQFIRSIRMEKAKALLEKGDLNISEIAYDTGFSSPTHFSRTFKKFYGVSPSEVASLK